MKKLNEEDSEFRFGDWGPKYLFETKFCKGGLIVVKPGTGLDKHYHDGGKKEIFYFLDGSPLLEINDERIRVKKGDVYIIEPGESHSIVNDTIKESRLIFILAPLDSDGRYIERPQIYGGEELKKWLKK